MKINTMKNKNNKKTTKRKNKENRNENRKKKDDKKQQKHLIISLVFYIYSVFSCFVFSFSFSSPPSSCLRAFVTAAPHYSIFFTYRHKTEVTLGGGRLKQETDMRTAAFSLLFLPLSLIVLLLLFLYVFLSSPPSSQLLHSIFFISLSSCPSLPVSFPRESKEKQT